MYYVRLNSFSQTLDIYSILQLLGCGTLSCPGASHLNELLPVEYIWIVIIPNLFEKYGITEQTIHKRI